MVRSPLRYNADFGGRMTRSRTAVVALMSTVLLALACDSACGRSFDWNFGNPPTQYASEGTVGLYGEEETALIACAMRAEITFVPGFFESEGGTIGELSLGPVEACEGIFRTLNANYRIVSRRLLGGEHLPREPELMTGILWVVANVEFLIERGGMACLYRGTLEMLTSLRWLPELGRWIETRIWFLPGGATIALVRSLREPPSCPRRVHWIGSYIPNNPRYWST